MSVSVDTLDKMFSEFIRKRAIASVGGCERCLAQKKSYSELQCSHFWSRHIQQTRWCIDNGAGLCLGCHSYFESRPLEHCEWYKKRLGLRYAILNKEAKAKYVPNTDDTYNALQILLKQFSFQEDAFPESKRHAYTFNEGKETGSRRYVIDVRGLLQQRLNMYLTSQDASNSALIANTFREAISLFLSMKGIPIDVKGSNPSAQPQVEPSTSSTAIERRFSFVLRNDTLAKFNRYIKDNSNDNSKIIPITLDRAVRLFLEEEGY